MNIKTVVKVMNFHSLLRVENSRKQAELYQTMSEELSNMVNIIMSNRNFQLDKKIVIPNSKLPVLRIYLGSDLGFCGSVNSSVSNVLKEDEGSEKIIIGKKIKNRKKEESLCLTREEIDINDEVIKDYFRRAVKGKTWSAIEVVYNHYFNISHVEQIIKRIYPLQIESQKNNNEWDDYIIEDDAGDMLEDMLISCLSYEMKIIAASAFASENIMRQNATTQSLKKLDEKEEDDLRIERKEKTQKAFNKTIESCIKQKILKGARQ